MPTARLQVRRQRRQAARCWRAGRRVPRPASRQAECLRRARPARPRSRWVFASRYSAMHGRRGSTMTTPASPSMITQSSWRISRLASRADHGRDVHAPRDDRRVRGSTADVGDESEEYTALELQHVGRGDVAATSTSGSSPLCSGLTTWLTKGEAPSPPRASTRQEPLDDLLEVGLALAQVFVLHLVELTRENPRAAPTAPIRRCSRRSRIHCFVAPVRLSSCSSIRCTSRRADSSAGASAGRSRFMRPSSRATPSRAVRSRSISASTSWPAT